MKEMKRKKAENKAKTPKKPVDLHVLWGLFLIFFKASSFTFAGGLAMIPVIQKDVVDKYRLMSKEEFLEYATLAQTMPGVIALNCATLVGRHSSGFLGMLFAGMGAIFPAFFLMLIATILLNMIPREGVVYGVMRGVRATSAALVLGAAFTLGRHNIKNAFAVILCLLSFFLVAVCHVGAPFAILGAGIAGYVFYRIRRHRKERRADVD